MANRLEAKKRKIVPKKDAKNETKEIVLVGTYKERQLEWIKKNGVYNYPVRDDDKFDEVALRAVKELWLFADVKAMRHEFKAEFVGKMSRKDFIDANPSYAKLPSKRTPTKWFYVFKAEPIEYKTLGANQIVLTRVGDFGGFTVKVKKAIEQFQKDGEIAPLMAYLPTALADVPREQLRVCEAAEQLELFSWSDFTPVIRPTANGYTAVELFAGAGGLSIGLERAGINVVIANEIMTDFASTLRANHPNTNVINEDIHKINFKEELEKIRLQYRNVA